MKVSILSAGTFVGALISFPLGDLLGRKFGLVGACVIFCLGVGLQLDTNWATFVVGRVIAGVGGMYNSSRSCSVLLLMSICSQSVPSVASSLCTSPRCHRRLSVD